LWRNMEEPPVAKDLEMVSLGADNGRWAVGSFERGKGW